MSFEEQLPLRQLLCLFHSANVFRSTRIGDGEYPRIFDIPQEIFSHGQSCNAFRPIARERKYLMDYNY